MYISAVTTVQVPPARTDLRKARSQLRGTTPARVVPRTDTDTIHDGGKATRATRTLARPNDISSLDLNDTKKNVYIHILL